MKNSIRTILVPNAPTGALMIAVGALLLAATVSSCGGDHVTKLDSWTDSVSYALGVQSAMQASMDSTSITEDMFKRGYNDGRAEKSTAEVSGLNTQSDSMSYGFGYQIGHHSLLDSVDINLDVMVQGINDAAGKKPLLLDSAQSLAAMMKLGEQIGAKHKEWAAATKKAGADFLEQNATKEGVTKTASGLEYKVLEPGSGPSPDSNSVVLMRYTGRLLNGTVFDSTSAEPASFPVTGVIPGWTEALLMMKKGAKWRVWIPSDLGYGDMDMGKIKPNSTLEFDMQLVDIKDTTIAQSPHMMPGHP